jgi:hypothetical protein
LEYSIVNNLVVVRVVGAEEGVEFTPQADGKPNLQWDFTIEDTKIYHLRVERSREACNYWSTSLKGSGTGRDGQFNIDRQRDTTQVPMPMVQE